MLRHTRFSLLVSPLAVFFVASALVTTGCTKRKPFEVEITDCPAVAVAKYTNSLTRFASSNEQTTDKIGFTAHITYLRNECDDLGAGVRSNIRFTINVKKGAAFNAVATNGASVTVKYFVVVMQGANKVIGKRVFETTLDFKGKADVARKVEEVRQEILTDAQAKAHKYEVLVGFQLSNDEAAYNLRP